MTEHQIEQAISTFATILYHKGYRGHFKLTNRGLRGLGEKETLLCCLKAYVKDHFANGGKGPKLWLETYASYKHAKDHILFSTKLRGLLYAKCRSSTQVRMIDVYIVSFLLGRYPVPLPYKDSFQSLSPGTIL